MAWYLVKLVVTALVVVAVSEIAKRSTIAGAILASLPLVSILAMIWLWTETRDTGRIAALSVDILWLVPPSLLLFILLPLLLRSGVGFWPALGASAAATALAYLAVLRWLRPLVH